MKKRLIRILVAAVGFAAAILLPDGWFWAKLALFIASYLVAGYDVVLRAIKGIARGNFFSENTLMSVATIGAFIIGEYPEAVAVMLFYQVGELFQSYAVAKSRKSIADLMDIRPDYANLKRGDTIEKVDPEEVQIGDTIIVRAGEKVPLDGTVLVGTSSLDTSALTGESLPREVTVDGEVLSGCININGLLTVQVTKTFEESTVNKILELVENASGNKAKTEAFITRFARYYTPAVGIMAILLAVIPPLVLPGAEFGDWVYRALTFLVVSCPCALVISVPLSFFGGIGGASKAGVLVKGGNYLEALARTEVAVFDKTGTLTKGVFKVQKIRADGMTEDELLELAAYAESHSSHPISQSLKDRYGKKIDNARIRNVEEIAGHGVAADVDGKTVYAGNAKLMGKFQIPYAAVDAAGTIVHVAVGKQYAGYILIADELKPDAAQAMQQLKSVGIRQTVMLTGDSKSVGEQVARDLGLDRVYTELLPGDKLAELEKLMAENNGKGNVAFVGDGINDAPVLARADVGIAMGGLGSDAAIEAADVVIMTDEPSKIVTAIRIARKTLSIARQNIGFALGIKAVVLILSAFGIATMWEAVFADVGVTVIAVLNSFRALRTKNM